MHFYLSEPFEKTVARRKTDLEDVIEMLAEIRTRDDLPRETKAKATELLDLAGTLLKDDTFIDKYDLWREFWEKLSDFYKQLSDT